jgi:hypothetical protein
MVMLDFDLSSDSRRGCRGWGQGQIMWDMWWTKWHWGRFSLITSVSSANSRSTGCSTLITYHLGLVQ